MEVTRRADAQALKAFITRKVDRVRLAYGRRSIDLPRQNVFVGTINADATNEYLSDSTGNRRFWPVRIGRVNFDELKAVRDQLFAEAVDLVLKGEPDYIIDDEIQKIAVIEQRKRQSTDPWQDQISEFMADKMERFVTTSDVWLFCLKGSESQLNVTHQRRIAHCLKEIGFVKHVKE